MITGRTASILITIPELVHVGSKRHRLCTTWSPTKPATLFTTEPACTKQTPIPNTDYVNTYLKLARYCSLYAAVFN